MLTIDEGLDGRVVTLAAGGRFEIRLAENPTTGFRWTLVADGAPGCEPDGDGFIAPGARPGRGGVHVWRFRAARPSRARIELAYVRPHAPGAAPARRFTVTVEVTATRR